MTERRTGDDERAHDVLAAEAFAVPTYDPALHHGPVELPADPVDDRPHDVLAAEEFAIPAGRPVWGGLAPSSRPSGSGQLVRVAGLIIGLVLLRRLLLRRR